MDEGVFDGLIEAVLVEHRDIFASPSVKVLNGPWYVYGVSIFDDAVDYRNEALELSVYGVKSAPQSFIYLNA